MPRRFRPGFPSHAAPLNALKALDLNLKRERHVFTILIGLLIFVALCLSAIEIAGIGYASLRIYALYLRDASTEAGRVIERRVSLLTGAAAVLMLTRDATTSSGLSPADQAPVRCTREFSELRASPQLEATCNHAARLANKISSDVPMLFLRVDGSAAYAYRLPLDPGAIEKSEQRKGDAARLLIDAALASMAARGLIPSPQRANGRSPGSGHRLAPASHPVSYWAYSACREATNPTHC